MPFQKGHKLATGRNALNLTEAQIRYAMANSKSNAEAARFLKISNDTYKKYADLYIDSVSGKTLYAIHSNMAGKNIRKIMRNIKGTRMTSLEDIYAGKKPSIKHWLLKDRLITNCVLEEKCNHCGFNERRVIDYRIPLILDFIDGNKLHFAKENLQLLCYNCTFLLRGNLHGKKDLTP